MSYTDEVDERAGHHKDRRVLGMVLLTLGVVFFLGHAGVFQAAGRTLASAALVAIGVGLIVTRRSPRPRWPVFAGAILTFALIGHSASQSFQQHFGSSFGSETFVPTKLSYVRPAYRMSFGSLRLDLHKVNFTNTRARMVEIDIAFGSANIVVPPRVQVEVKAVDTVGAVNVEGQRLHDAGPNRVWSTPGFDASKGGLVLDVHVFAGATNIVLAGVS